MKIFNTLTREKEEFVPIEQGKVKMYACGPTVYNFIHIGNARPICVFDTMRRYLEFKGYDVTFVQNFTDIDDKIIKKANEEGVTAKEIAERYINEYLTDTKGLGIREAPFIQKQPKPSMRSNTSWKPSKTRALLTKQTAMFCSAPRKIQVTANYPISRWKSSKAVPESVSVNTRKILWTSFCGNPQNRENHTGLPAGVKVVQAGISNVPQ